MTEQELERREEALRMAMERILPEFVKSCAETDGPLLILDVIGAQPALGSLARPLRRPQRPARCAQPRPRAVDAGAERLH